MSEMRVVVENNKQELLHLIEMHKVYAKQRPDTGHEERQEYLERMLHAAYATKQ